MTVSKVRINKRTKQELGQVGINEMCRHLYPGDCQTCGRPLGIRPPAVTVDDYGSNAQAQLHHESCQRPRWTERTVVVNDLRLPAALTHEVHWLLPRGEVFPGMGSGVPILLLNSGLEAVTLERGEQGWRVSTVERYVSYGLHPASADARVRSVRGSHAVVGDPGDGSNPTTAVYIDPLRCWNAETPHFIANAVVRQRGLILLVTSAVRPTTVTPASMGGPELFALIGSGQCAAGWVPLRGAAS